MDESTKERLPETDSKAEFDAIALYLICGLHILEAATSKMQNAYNSIIEHLTKAPV